MAQLKDIKSRLQSIRSTQKITTAMMMVSSAKLRKSQNILENLSPYSQKLSQLLYQLLSGEEPFSSPFTEPREIKRVAIVAFSSNTGLAGRFNNNISTELLSTVESYLPLGKENILIYTVGSKAAKSIAKKELSPYRDYSEISGNPNYGDAKMIAEELMEMFLEKKIDRVELIYHHFKSKGSQIVTREQFLPFELERDERDKIGRVGAIYRFPLDYIIEPDRLTIIEQLLPKVIKVKLFTTHVDASTSEHAARMIAMQIANDNADELIEELTREYNKLRQESITNELLDIVGGALGKY